MTHCSAHSTSSPIARSAKQAVEVSDETNIPPGILYLHWMRTEMRRGSLAMAVLAALHAEHYGYSLRKRLLEVGIDIDEGTLYPLIRRLEGYGLLTSEWRDSEGRKRRYYQASADGRWALEQMRAEWDRMSLSLQELLGGAT